VETSCALASENKDSYLLRIDTVWVCAVGRIEKKKKGKLRRGDNTTSMD
jgi:hypothetical protein